MDTDEIFVLFFVVIGVGLYLDDALKHYGYDRAISEVKLFTTILIILLIIIFIVILVYIKWSKAKRRKKELKIVNPKKRVSRVLKTAKPIVLPEIPNQHFTEEVSPKILDVTKTIETPQEAIIPKRMEVSTPVDSDKGFFRFKELKLDDVKYLLAKGYRISEHKSLSSNKKEKFLLKVRFNESERHCFVVYDIADFLENKGVQVSKFITKKPDLVFEINLRKFAIEVETGKNRYKTDKLIEKVNLLKDYDYWFFVVTNRNCSKEYRKFGKVVELRRLRNFLLKLLKNGHIKSSHKNNKSRRKVTENQSKKSLPIIET